jgi:hypothetical protein
MEMNSQRVLFVAAPLAAFVLTVAVSLWPRHEEQPAPRLAPAAAESPGPALSGPASPTTTTQASTPAPAQTPDSPPSTQNTGDPEVPVSMIARGASDKAAAVAVLVNLTSDELDVRVTAVSAKTSMRTSIDVALLANQRKNVSDAGLEFAPGDQITVESSAYRNRTFRAQ